MASPLSTFQKNRRVWMAGAVFIAIVAFVISPMLGYFSNANRVLRGGSNRTVASWNGGSLSQAQLESEHLQLQYANQFLRKLAMDVQEKGGSPNVPEFNPDLSYLGITVDNDSLERILERKILVAEAQRLGIHFDETSVKTFIQRFVDGRLDGNQIMKTLRETTNGRLSWYDFTQLMQEELAKNEVLRLAGAGLRFEDRRESRTLGRPPLTTPGKNWQDFLRFNRAAKIQAFPVFASDFDSQVKGKPSEREIKALYEEGKDLIRTAKTIATQPAFMRPSAAKFEYLVIDVEKLITEEMKLIPEDTLRAEYDRRVAQKDFRVPIIPEATGTPVVPGTTNPEGGDKPASTEPAATEPAATEPASTEPASTEPASEQPTAPESPATAPAGEPTLPPALPDPQNNARNAGPTSNIKLVSFQDNSQEPAAPAPAAQESPASPQPPTPAETPTPETPAQTQPAQANKPLENAAVPSNPSLELSQPPASPAPQEAANSTPMRTKTFEEVKDQIAREQATGKAYKIVEDRIGVVFTPMGIYQSELRAYEQSKREKANDVKAPKPLDLEKLGAENGFEYGTTGLVDSDTVLKQPIGSSFVMRVGNRQQPVAFSALINVSEGAGATYTPLTSINFTGGSQRFVFWKTEDIPSTIPSLDSVRDQVFQVWEKQQAFKLAEARAIELKGKVGNATLKDSLATEDEKNLILEPSSFTWFNPMFARMESRMQLSNVELLRPIDESFMEAVFACQPGETTVAPDANKTVYYVVQVQELTPDTGSLLQKFAVTPLEGVSTISRLESDRSIQPWFQNLKKQLGFRAD